MPLWSSSPKGMLIGACVLAQVAVTLGVWGSVWLNLQTGLSIVLVLALGFFVSFVVAKIYQS